MSGGITGISLAIVCPPRPVGQWTDLSNLDYAKSRRRAERTRLVAPEMAEGLLEVPSPGRGQLAGQQGVELLARPPADAAAPAQQHPAQVLEALRLLRTLRPQAGAFGAPHLIHRLIHMHRDVETVQHLQ